MFKIQRAVFNDRSVCNCKKRIKMSDDESHLIALKTDSEYGFAILYKRYWHQVYNFCRLYVKSRDVAEEIVQDVFVKVWESRKLIREDDNFKGLLFIITRNLVFNQYRKNINEDLYKITVLSSMEVSYSIEEEIDARDLSDYIDSLIKDLPTRRREIFDLSRKKNMSYKEIAGLLDISEKTVENQISEALKYLKSNLPLLTIFLLCGVFCM